MGKTVAMARVHFGRRIMQLLGEKEWSLADLSRRAKVPYRTLQNWTKRESPPRGGQERIERVEEILGGSLTAEPPGGEKVMLDRIREGSGLFPGEPRRYAQPLDFKKRALDEVGRARHELAAVLAAIEGETFDLAEIILLIEKADDYAGKAQRHLLGRIKINDRGEKV